MERQRGNWQYLLSPDRFTTPILRRAYRPGEMLETGFPRIDVLAGEERERAERASAARLDVPTGPGSLYAPTYRDDARDPKAATGWHAGARRRAAARVAGDDTMVLFRNHHS